MSVQQDVIYKITRAGTALGVLSDVKSDFSFNQNINSPGSQVAIEVGRTPDNTTPDFGDGALIQEGNDVEIVVVNDNYPNGKTKFKGYISDWTANYGGTETILITCLSYGFDLDQHVIMGAPVLDQSQVVSNTTILINSGVTAPQLGQSIAPTGGIPGINRVSLKMAAVTTNNPIVTMSLYASGTLISNLSRYAAQTAPDASISLPITSTSPAVYDFILQYFFPGAVPAAYILNITCTDASGVNVYYQNSNVYANGTMLTTITEPTKDLYFQTYYQSLATNATYSTQDPSAILTDIIRNYNYDSTRIVPPGAGYSNTGLSVSYPFKVNTVLEGVQKILSLSPQDWYWYVDMGTNTLNFLERGTTADHTIIKGKHINELNLKRTAEYIKNVVYFSGGDTGGGSNLFLKKTNATSLASYPVGLDRLSDNRVNDATIGGALAQDDLDRNPSPVYQTDIKIPASVYDIDSFILGQLVAIGNFANFIDTLLLQIVAINYNPGLATLTLGSLAPRSTQAINDIQRALALLQTIDNPSTPS